MPELGLAVVRKPACGLSIGSHLALTHPYATLLATQQLATAENVAAQRIGEIVEMANAGFDFEFGRQDIILIIQNWRIAKLRIRSADLRDVVRHGDSFVFGRVRAGRAATLCPLFLIPAL